MSDLEYLTIPDPELKNLRVGEERQFDFDEGTTLPLDVYLQNTDRKIKGTGKRLNRKYAGGRLIVTYEITEVSSETLTTS